MKRVENYVTEKRIMTTEKHTFQPKWGWKRHFRKSSSLQKLGEILFYVISMSPQVKFIKIQLKNSRPKMHYYPTPRPDFYRKCTIVHLSANVKFTENALLPPDHFDHTGGDKNRYVKNYRNLSGRVFGKKKRYGQVSAKPNLT